MITDTELREHTDAIATHFGWNAEYVFAVGKEWARNENTNAVHNPFACTQAMEGSTIFNGDGVREYASVEDGARAFILTIDPNAYGGIDFYPNIRRWISSMTLDSSNRAIVAQEMRKWGTSDFADEIIAGWTPTIDAPIEATPPPAETPIPDTVPASPIIDATLETRVARMEARLDELNNAVLARLSFIADAFRIGADPNHVPE